MKRKNLSKSAVTAMLVAGGLVAALPGITPARASCGPSGRCSPGPVTKSSNPCAGKKTAGNPCAGKKK
ncbi:MAG: hypothetical protein AB7O50_07970 [Pseudolabrys sp.]